MTATCGLRHLSTPNELYRCSGQVFRFKDLQPILCDLQTHRCLFVHLLLRMGALNCESVRGSAGLRGALADRP